MDEKGFLMGIGFRVKGICVRGRKSPPHAWYDSLLFSILPYLLTTLDGKRETITVLETIAADGRFLQ